MTKSGRWNCHRTVKIDGALPHRHKCGTGSCCGNSQPVRFWRVLGFAAGLAAACLSFLPGIGSSISVWPAMRLRPFFAEADACLSWATLRRRASIKSTTLVREGSFGRSIFSPFCFLCRSSLARSRTRLQISQARTRPSCLRRCGLPGRACP